MARVYVGIGSNIDRERHIRAGVTELGAAYGRLILSTVYESAAVGFTGADFFNLVAGFDTNADLREVARRLREIEDRHGRSRGGPRLASRTLDIDLLLYDDLVSEEPGLLLPRADIARNAFVLRPLSEIAPDGVHPLLGRSYRDLWEGFDGRRQPLRPVRFDWGDAGKPETRS